MHKLNRRDFLKAAGMGIAGIAGAAFLPKRKPPKRKKKMIRNAGNSVSGLKTTQTYSWAHVAPALNDEKQLYGLLVDVVIFGSATVTSITATDQSTSIVRNLTLIPNAARTGTGLRVETWILTDLRPNVYDIGVTLSAGSVNSCGGASTYAFFGGVGMTDSGLGTSAGVSSTLASVREHSIIRMNFASDAITGIVDAFANQNRRCTNETASGTQAVSDIGPISPIPEEGTDIGFDGAGGSDDFAWVAIELLNENRTAHAIG